jgi:hypothetical protein
LNGCLERHQPELVVILQYPGIGVLGLGLLWHVALAPYQKKSCVRLCGKQHSDCSTPIAEFLLPHLYVVSINTDMALEIPLHSQQQFTFVIHELQGIIGKEFTRAYLRFLSNATESDSELPVNPSRHFSGASIFLVSKGERGQKARQGPAS